MFLSFFHAPGPIVSRTSRSNCDDLSKDEQSTSELLELLQRYLRSPKGQSNFGDTCLFIIRRRPAQAQSSDNNMKLYQ